MIINLGSINADYFYQVPRIPSPGETMPATGLATGLGGKGANQSVAAARAGANVVHIGAVGPDGGWAIDRLAGFGVDTTHIQRCDSPTGHAIISVASDGENAIVTYAGANAEVDAEALQTVLACADSGDWLILQNESPHGALAARAARERGMRVIYSAAPFMAGKASVMAPLVDLMILNEVEAGQLAEALGRPLTEVPVPGIVVTKGAGGVSWHDLDSGEIVSVPAFPVTPIDTTGAGDCFAGYLAAGLSEGMARAPALRFATAAAAIKVTRSGTADAIPSRSEVDAFLDQPPANGA